MERMSPEQFLKILYGATEEQRNAIFKRLIETVGKENANIIIFGYGFYEMARNHDMKKYNALRDSMAEVLYKEFTKDDSETKENFVDEVAEKMESKGYKKAGVKNV